MEDFKSRLNLSNGTQEGEKTKPTTNNANGEEKTVIWQKDVLIE